MQNISRLTIEITLVSSGVLRVIERSSSASTAIHKVLFDENALDALIAETHRSLFAINTNNDLPANSFRRLGAQIAALVLPQEINGKVERVTDAVDFYLDDYSLKIPIEILPCQDNVLAAKVPVIRHWLYDANNATPGKVDLVGAKATKNALLVADPAGDLPSAAEEGQSIMRFLKEKKTPWRCRYLGHSVTADAVTHELPDTELLHIAAHYHDGSDKEGHGISVSDGLWLPDRIPHTPDIIFLNCCRAGQIYNDHGSQSLIGKFLQHGTQHVIAPFLPTSDVIAKRFAEEFYRVFDTPDTVMESVFKTRQALGAIGLLYLHYGTQIEKDAFPTKRISSRYRGPLFATLLALGCGLLAATGTVEYQKHRSSQEMEQQLAEVRLLAAQDTERQLNDLRLHSTREMERQLADTRRQSEQETEQRIEQMRLQSEREMERRLVETRQQSEQEMKRQIEGERTRAQEEAEEWLEQERLQEIGERLDREEANSTRIPGMMHTLMGEAAKTGDIPVMELVLSRDWPIDGFDEYGLTAFGHAVEAGQIEAMEWLKEHGADIHKHNKNQSVPLHIAAFARNFPVMEWLYNNGVDVNVQDFNGNTAMLYAAHKGFVDVMQWLYDRGAKVDTANTAGHTPLVLAEEQGNDEAIQWLKKMLATNGTGTK